MRRLRKSAGHDWWHGRRLPVIGDVVHVHGSHRDRSGWFGRVTDVARSRSIPQFMVAQLDPSSVTTFRISIWMLRAIVLTANGPFCVQCAHGM